VRKKGGRKKKQIRAAGQWQGIIAGRVGRSFGIAIKERGGEERKGEGEQREERRASERVDRVRRGEEGRRWTV
jgi:hypothetical protein